MRFAFAVRCWSSHTHSSMYSTRDRSIPVGESTCVIERQRVPSACGRTQLGAPVFTSAVPSTVSGFRLSQSTGSADCACPTTRMVGSICCGRNWIGWPRKSIGRLCQVRAAAALRSNPAGEMPNASTPRAVVGMLPHCQLFSASDRKRPASASNSSTYAWPAWFGLGRDIANSAETLRSDGASVWIPGRTFSARVTTSGWKCSSVLTPPMKLEDGSKPSGGRVNALCSR